MKETVYSEGCSTQPPVAVEEEGDQNRWGQMQDTAGSQGGTYGAAPVSPAPAMQGQAMQPVQPQGPAPQETPMQQPVLAQPFVEEEEGKKNRWGQAQGNAAPQGNSNSETAGQPVEMVQGGPQVSHQGDPAYGHLGYPQYQYQAQGAAAEGIPVASGSCGGGEIPPQYAYAQPQPQYMPSGHAPQGPQAPAQAMYGQPQYGQPQFMPGGYAAPQGPQGPAAQPMQPPTFHGAPQGPTVQPAQAMYGQPQYGQPQDMPGGQGAPKGGPAKGKPENGEAHSCNCGGSAHGAPQNEAYGAQYGPQYGAMPWDMLAAAFGAPFGMQGMNAAPAPGPVPPSGGPKGPGASPFGPTAYGAPGRGPTGYGPMFGMPGFDPAAMGGAFGPGVPQFDQRRYGQLLEIYNDIMEGKPDPAKLAGLFSGSDGYFWKGALVGAALTLLVTNQSLRSALGECFSSIFGKNTPETKA